jgi:hypothetical protein
MSISSTYRSILVEDYIKEQLRLGVALSAEDIESYITETIDALDLTAPQFVAEDSHVVSKTSSSASSFTQTLTTIQQDLRALYKEMISLTKVGTNTLERWELESSALEKKLVDLEERIDSLLTLAHDVGASQGIVIDNFSDMNLVDKSLTTADVDIKSQSVQMNNTGSTHSRIFLNDITQTDDVRFKVRTNADFESRIDAENSSIINPFKQQAETWWTSIIMKKVKPVSCEYTVRITSGDSVPLSKIFISLHDSVESSPIHITPLYSTDNISYSQLPTNTFTQEIRGSGTFVFSEVNAKWIKFILTKQGPDLSSSENKFSYQFGFKEISFFYESFDTSATSVFTSEPLSVLDEDSQPIEYEKLSLQICERVEDDTSIKYFITTSNDSTVPIDSNTIWTPISPTDHVTPQFPTVITVGDLTDGIIGDDEDVVISTDADSDSSSFYLIGEDTNGAIVSESKSTTSARYTYRNHNDRILNYQVKDRSYTGTPTAITINEQNFLLFRNVGEQGLDPSDEDNLVRDYLRGWSFEDPYYITVVEILNPEGITINIGDHPMIVDGIPYTIEVNSSVLTGKTSSTTGIHKIKVHKSRWRHITQNLDSLDALKAADPLYPYNHRMLIEGYLYGSSYPSTSEKLYAGVDTFASALMKSASVFDIYTNVEEDNYDMYAFDRDAPGTHSNDESTKVILLKADVDNSDYQNEKFMLKFTRINQLKKYLRFRAELTTEDTKITPALHAYKVKLV